MAGERSFFERFELAPSRGELRLGGVKVAIAPKPLAVLGELVRSHPRVVTKHELLGSVWPGVSVSPAAFTSVLRLDQR